MITTEILNPQEKNEIRHANAALARAAARRGWREYNTETVIDGQRYSISIKAVGKKVNLDPIPEKEWETGM